MKKIGKWNKLPKAHAAKQIALRPAMAMSMRQAIAARRAAAATKS